MGEIQLKDLTPKSQKSRFGSAVVGEASRLDKMYRGKAPLEVLEGSARANVAHRAYVERLRKEADVDPLTGALNRRAMQREIREAMAEVDRKGGHIQIIFMDLRGFKQFNDTYGHKVGDDALRALVNGVRGHIRPYDTIGRWGGEEFILLLKSGEAELADRLSDRLHSTMRNLKAPYNQIKADMGSADYHESDSQTPADQLIHQADQAMYFAKKHNLHGVKHWDPSVASIVVPKKQ